MTGEDLYKQFVKDLLQLSEAYPGSDLEPGPVSSGLLSSRCALFRGRLHGGLLRRRPLGRPPFLQCRDNGSPACSTQPAFRLCRGFGCGLRFTLGCRPSFPLRIANALPGGCTPPSPFALCWFRRGGKLGAPTGQHGTEFGNLSVETQPLLFKTFDGGADDFGSKFMRGHRD
jgi:hypothetical protein